MTCKALIRPPNKMAFFHPNILLQNDLNQNPTILPSLNPQFHGLLGKRSPTSFPVGIDEIGQEHVEDAGEKKRRLNTEQVRMLEKNFELGNKLEPDRKIQLARELGLQPRQIAIWFQNRRVRWKTKQLEKDYDLLRRQLDAVKADNDRLQAQNHNLHDEISALKSREPTESINLNKETEGSCSNRSENSFEIRLDISRTPTAARPSGEGVHQLFQGSGRPEMEGPKMDSSVSMCNVFCGVDDQTGFWPCLEQQHFN